MKVVARHELGGKIKMLSEYCLTESHLERETGSVWSKFRSSKVIQPIDTRKRLKKIKFELAKRRCWDHALKRILFVSRDTARVKGVSFQGGRFGL